MDFKRHSIILEVIDSLHRQGSWTGKTHVQKALSLLHDAGEVAVPFRFVLYKHGPYSFDVEEDLEQMQSYKAVAIEVRVQGYGVVLNPGEMAHYPRDVAPLTEKEKTAIDRACAFVGQKSVVELERLATAAWIRRRENLSVTQAVVDRLRKLKPHITPDQAAAADTDVSRWLAAVPSETEPSHDAPTSSP